MATDKIERLIDDGIVDELVQRVKTGKEAEVYVVRKGGEYFAAKVYKERTERNFRNNVGYREGRAVRNTRDMRAMAKGSKYGLDRAENEWMHTEHDACIALAEAGVRVPKAELFYEGVFLMELVLDASGAPAPRLIEVAFTEEEALALHAELTEMIVRMLLTDRIHGDLSAYNILLAWNGPTIIDFPQVVSAAHNSQAASFLIRDVRNVTEFLARFAPSLKARSGDGARIWRAFERRELAPGFIPADHPEFEPSPKQAAAMQEGAPAFPTARREVSFSPPPRPARPPRANDRAERRDGAPKPERRDGAPPHRTAGERPTGERTGGDRKPPSRGPRPDGAPNARPPRDAQTSQGRHGTRPHAAAHTARADHASSKPRGDGQNATTDSTRPSRHGHQRRRRAGSPNRPPES